MKELLKEDKKLFKTEDSGQPLPVMEQFYSIQGEGFHQGKAAWFIRLAGCDVGCFWCDVKESWDAGAHSEFSLEDLVKKASSQPARIAIITGGEPLMYDCSGLTGRLQLAGFATHLETSGAYPLTGFWDWICLSPKKFKKPLQETIERADELKIVVYNKSDFDWAESYAERVKEDCQLYLQPEWSKIHKILPELVAYIKSNPKWRISLQVHKYMQLP